MVKNKSTQQKKQRKEDGNPSGRPRPQSQRPRSLSESFQRCKEYPGFLYSAESYASVKTHVMSLS